MPAPEMLTLKHHRDLEGRAWQIWIRRTLMGLISVVPIVALFNVFGQHPTTAVENAPDASLQLYAPTDLRGGVIYMARFTITAKNDLKQANLILSPGWGESITINTIEPSPIGEGSSNGKLVFQLGHIPAGNAYKLFMDFQVNPTNVGSHVQDVTLADGGRALTTLHRSVFVWP